MDLPSLPDALDPGRLSGPVLAAVVGGSFAALWLLQRSARLLTAVLRWALWAVWLGGAAWFLAAKGHVPPQALGAFVGLLLLLFFARTASVRLGASPFMAGATVAGGLWGFLSGLAAWPSGAALARGAWTIKAAAFPAWIFVKFNFFPRALTEQVPGADRSLWEPFIVLGLPLLLGAGLGLLAAFTVAGVLHRDKKNQTTGTPADR